MIRFLSIQNLAVVDAVELNLESGLIVLTGETGAGKSIVLGALGLLLGGRSTSDLVRSGESRTQVQATIEDDDGTERILRREVTAQGRSRAFVDDVLTTGGSLRQTIAAVERAGGQPVAVAVLIDRSAGRTDFGLPFLAGMTLDIGSYAAADCPQCAAGEPLIET